MDKVSVRDECAGKQNEVYFTHADWDHISFIRQARKILPNLCRRNWPREKLSRKKQYWLRQIPPCSNRPSSNVQDVSEVESLVLKRKVEKRDLSANDLSHVFVWSHLILVPGDSPSRQEKRWRHQLTSAIQLLVLGHHGSRTSTSELLLSSLPHLLMAWASARKAKYGHPHQSVINRLSRHHIPLLTTESWHHLRWQIPSPEEKSPNDKEPIPKLVPSRR